MTAPSFARTAALLMVLLAGVGCGSTDQAYYTSDGRRLRDIAPLPYRIALAAFPGEQPAQPVPDKGLGFTLSDTELLATLEAVLGGRREKIEALGLHDLHIEEQRTAVEVVSLKARTLEDAMREAQAARADLLIMPRFAETPAFRYETTTRETVSTLLWLFTWVGGLHVQDKTYEARASFDFSILNPYDGTPLATYTATSEKMDLTLWERNEREFKDGVLWSMIMPPWVAIDNRTSISRTLTRLVCARIAARLSGYLKQDFSEKERERIGTLRSIEPKNGSDRMGRTLDLGAEIVADEQLTDCAIYVAGAKEAHWKGPVAEQVNPTDQAEGTIYRINVRPTRPIPLNAEGSTEIRIEYAVRGRYTSRTLVYWSGPRPIVERK